MPRTRRRCHCRRKYKTLALKAARFVVRRQHPDGSWSYGTGSAQGWADNFHTAYVLTSLYRIKAAVPASRADIEPAFDRGLGYWLSRFFLANGTPKYYNNSVYPIDVHAAAAAIVTLCEVRHLDMARKVAQWTIEHMRDTDGFFYYQLRKRIAINTPFMRWGQAWMAYALARLIEAGKDAQ